MTLGTFVDGLTVGVLAGIALVALAAREKPPRSPAASVEAPAHAGSNPVEDAARMVEASPPGTEPPDAFEDAEAYCSPGCPACVCACSEDMDVRKLAGFGRGDFCVTHEARWRVLAGGGVDNLLAFEIRLRWFVITPTR